jgi:hypothetical protein
VTGTKPWGPTPTETVGTEVDYQVAAPLKREHPTCTERQSLDKECGWKDGDRGGPAQTQNPLVRKRRTDLTLTGLLMEGLGDGNAESFCQLRRAPNPQCKRRVFYITDTGREQAYLLYKGRAVCIAFLRNLVRANFSS